VGWRIGFKVEAPKGKLENTSLLLKPYIAVG